MYVVKLNGLMVVQSDQLRDCMKWLTSKAAEYDSERVNWLPGPGQDILTLVAGTQQWTLCNTREYFHWTISCDGICIGIFAYLEDAKASVQMTWGKAVFTPDNNEIMDPVDTYQFACGQASGVLQRVRLSKSATKLTRD